MPTDQFISFKEAAELAGVSKKTIERFHTKRKDKPEYADAFETKPRGKSVQYFIAESVVRKEIVKDSQQGSRGSTNSIADEAIREALNQVKEKDKQIEKKDEQIKNLQESLKAEQLLHLDTKQSRKGLLGRTRVLLFGNAATNEGGIENAATTSSNQSTSLRTYAIVSLSTLAALAVTVIARVILSFYV